MKHIDNFFKNPNFYIKGENGHAVLIFHGFTASLAQSEILFNYLSVKGFTVFRPLLAGHRGDAHDLNDYGPEYWMKELKESLNKISAEAKEIYIVGISFGAALAISLANTNDKIKGLALLEMPVLFRSKINFMINFVLPIFCFLGIYKITKNKFFYRKEYKHDDKEDSINYLPLKTVSRLNKFIKKNLKNELNKINKPCLIVNAKDSDLLSPKNTEYILNNLKSSKKEHYQIDINNHDLDVLDETGKMILIEKIYNFFNKIYENQNQSNKN